jgi:hypothetical protein
MIVRHECPNRVEAHKKKQIDIEDVWTPLDEVTEDHDTYYYICRDCGLHTYVKLEETN